MAFIQSSLSSQIWAMGNTVINLLNYRKKNTEDYNNAIAAMRSALNRTRMFLENDPDFSDLETLFEISQLWNEASKHVGVIDKATGISLGEKSRFWSDHQLFIRTGKDKEILQLNEVVDKIDRFYNQLK